MSGLRKRGASERRERVVVFDVELAHPGKPVHLQPVSIVVYTNTGVRVEWKGREV
jgi:hypothetical protein